jgi:hypothetical protein
MRWNTRRRCSAGVLLPSPKGWPASGRRPGFGGRRGNEGCGDRLGLRPKPSRACVPSPRSRPAPPHRRARSPGAPPRRGGRSAAGCGARLRAPPRWRRPSGTGRRTTPAGGRAGDPGGGGVRARGSVGRGRIGRRPAALGARRWAGRHREGAASRPQTVPTPRYQTRPTPPPHPTPPHPTPPNPHPTSGCFCLIGSMRSSAPCSPALAACPISGLKRIEPVAPPAAGQGPVTLLSYVPLPGGGEG